MILSDVDRILRLETILASYITNDPELIKIKNLIRKIANLNYPVLLRGETGVGKDHLAKALHGTRCGEFFNINIAAIPETMIESELFGSVVGSYTGAADRNGILVDAKGGTVFLNEIGNIPINIQAKLHTILEDMVIRHVGGTKQIPISCRFIFATNRDIEKMIRDGLFMEDLYPRISTIEIRIPPLRNRLGDIPLILQHIFNGTIPDDFIIPTDVPYNVRSLINDVIRYRVSKL